MGAVGEMQARTRPVREVERLDRRGRLRDRRVAESMCQRIVLGRRVEELRERVIDDLLQLVVENDRNPGGAELLEGGDEIAVGDAREAVSVVLEQRELERADAALDEFVEHPDAVEFRHRAVETNVDDRLRLNGFDLLA